MGKEQELLEAARNGNQATVERILNHRIKKSGPLASLRRGPGPNTQDTSGYTCLHHAALNGHKEVVIFLLTHDANPNIVDNKGSTALHLAAWSGNYEVLHMLLTQSSSVPNVNLKNNDQDTALHCAAQYGHTSVVSLLLQHGADPSVRNNKQESPLDLGAQYGRYETVDVLLRTRPNLVKDLVKKHSPLHLASRNGHKHVVKMLLNAKFDVNYLAETGTALHEAALYGKIEVVKLLLDYGVDVELEDEQKRTVTDLLNDLNTNIAKQTKKLIKEHTTLVSTEDDSSTVISDSSSHCISPPPGYTDTTPEHHALYSSVPHRLNLTQSPTAPFTSPANSEFNFYEVPPPPRLSVHSKRSSGTSDDYRSARSGFSRSQDSILDGYSTSSSRSPSFLDYEAGPPLPPRERLASTRGCLSSDSADLLYEVPMVPPQAVNGDYATYASIKRKSSVNRHEEDVSRPDSQSSTGTWSNHSSSGYVPMGGKPAPPAKPPRKSVSPLNRALGQQQFYSKSQHQLHLQSNRASGYDYTAGGADSSMKRSASNDGDGYVDMRPSGSRFSTFLGAGATQNDYDNQRLISESAFSILYDEIANGSSAYGSTPPPPHGHPHPHPSASKVSSLSRKPQRPPPLHQHVRSKSEHHPRCPNFHIHSHSHSHSQPHSHSHPDHCPHPPQPPPHSQRTLRKSDTDDLPQRKRDATMQIAVRTNQSNDGNGNGPNNNTYPPPSPTPDYYGPPSPESAEQGIRAVIKPLSQTPDDGCRACHGLFVSNGDCEWPPAREPLPRFTESRSICGDHFLNSVPVDPEFYNSVSDCELDDDCFEYAEYKRNVKRRSKDMDTTIEEDLFSTFDSSGKMVQIRLRNAANRVKLENKLVATDITHDDVHPHVLPLSDNPFAGLCRGSVGNRLSQASIGDGKKSLRRTKHHQFEHIGTAERRKKSKSMSFKNENKPKAADVQKEPTEKPVTIVIKPIEIDCVEDAPQEPPMTALSFCPFDENKEWAEIENIMASFGSGFGRESLFADDAGDKQLTPDSAENTTVTVIEKKEVVKSVEEWMTDIGLPEYAHLLVPNGFDNLSYMGPNVMEESDLQEIGINNSAHIEKILAKAKAFPPIKELDKSAKVTLDEWLSTLKLIEYSDKFKENGFADIETVRKIWEVELNAVLEINRVGHRKRILASLGERLSLMTDLGFEDLDFDKLNIHINEFTSGEPNVGDKVVSNDEEQPTLPALPALPEPESGRQSAASDFKVDPVRGRDSPQQASSETSNSNRTSIQSTVALNHQWRHDPSELVKDSCDYTAFYLGSTLVKQLQGIESTRESIKKLQESTRDIMKIPSVILSISYTGVKFIDAQTCQMVCEHEIRNIHCACQDADDFKHFAYITKELETSNHYCHVFCGQNLDLATEVILTLGQAFEVAYQMALGEDIATLSKAYNEALLLAAAAPPPPPPPVRTVSSLSSSQVHEKTPKNVPTDHHKECFSFSPHNVTTPSSAVSFKAPSSHTSTKAPEKETEKEKERERETVTGTPLAATTNNKDRTSEYIILKSSIPKPKALGMEPVVKTTLGKSGVGPGPANGAANNNNNNNKPSLATKPSLRPKPVPPTKPASLTRSSTLQSPSGTLTRKGKGS